MERYITDEIYRRISVENSAELMMDVQSLCSSLAEHYEKEEYQQIEEQLYKVFSLLERDGFHVGFIEGIRFVVKCS